MGYGVFAATPIFNGQLLDEYFGELLPPRVAAARHDDDYLFGIRNVASSSARDFANWTRFVNHSCRDFNVEAVNDVLGGRRTITFRACRNIKRGDELLIDYGTDYFGDKEGEEILCRCPAFPNPHIPPNQVNKAPENQQAFAGQQPQPSVKPPDVSIAQQNAWITESKAWLAGIDPNGHSHWTMLHWRLLEQLIRRRRNHNDWRSKPEYNSIPSSRGDPLIATYITKERSQMKIFEWHLDVAKAFQRDTVCGTRQGVPWETSDLLKRIFAVNVAARRRRRKSGRRRSFATTPTLTQEPATPPGPSGTAPGNIPTPPATGGPENKTTDIDYPELPSDIPTPAATVRQARRASARRRRRQQQQSDSP